MDTRRPRVCKDAGPGCYKPVWPEQTRLSSRASYCRKWTEFNYTGRAMKAGNHFGRVETDPMVPNQLGKYTTRRKDRVVPLAKMSAGLLSVHY